MNDERSVALMFALVLVVCGALLYLDWRRQGEIELLHERFDAFEVEAFTRVARSFADDAPADELNERITARAFEPLVDRILHASDDRTLADIAREGAR